MYDRKESYTLSVSQTANNICRQLRWAYHAQNKLQTFLQ